MGNGRKLGLALIIAAVSVTVWSASADAAAAWKCGKKHCFWTEGYKGPVPEFAAKWAAPSGPGCYYVLRAKTKWVEFCPSTRPLQ
jgi:hypothetical protein